MADFAAGKDWRKDWDALGKQYWEAWTEGARAATKGDPSMLHEGFEQWWEPFTLGVGPAGSYVSSLDEDRKAAVQQRCREILGPGPLTVQARVWAARGYVTPA